MEKLKLYFLAFVGAVLSFLFVSSFAFAEGTDFYIDSGAYDTANEAGYQSVAVDNNVIESMVGKVIKTVMLYLGVFFLLLTIYGGLIWMFSRGNDQEVEKAKKIIQNALIGLIVVMMAYAITYFFMSSLQS